jgi:5'-methylthioadenosine phosphorylase
VDTIIAVLNANAALSQRIVAEVVDRLAAGYTSIAHSALATAIITDRSRIPAETKERLSLIAGKYL